MQKLRAVAVAVIATFVVTAGASAQEMRNFDNSWFWGFKSGINTFTAPGRGNTSTVIVADVRKRCPAGDWTYAISSSFEDKRSKSFACVSV